MANLKDLLVNGSTNHIGRNYSQTPALGTKDRQVATTEFVLDNCYKPPLLSFMWADHLLNDMSWLRADTFSWQDGTTYSLIYNELLSEYNNSASTTVTEGSITFKRTPKGYKIALATQENAILNLYNTTGIAWYYILDTTNQRFKLPRTKFGFEGLRTNVGDDIEAGLPNHKHRVAGEQEEGGSDLTAYPDNAIKYTGITGGSDYKYTLFAYTIGDEPTLGVTGSASVINSIYGNSNTVQPPATQTYLYFYVGEFARNSVQQTAGLNSELFNNKLDLNANNLDNNGKSLISGLGMPSGKYIDLTLGESGSVYTAPANGYFAFSTANTSSAVNYTYLRNETKNMCFYAMANAEVVADGFIPVKKGDIVSLGYFSSIIDTFKFIYAEGSK